jgi:hypothetical protein
MYGLTHFQFHQEIHFVELIIFTVIVQQFSVGRDFLSWELSAESTQISLKAQQAGPNDPSCPEPAMRRLASQQLYS